MPCLGQPPVEHEVTVQNGTRAVGNRVLLVIAFGQHGIESGNRTATGPAVARTLDQLRQLGKH